MAKIKSSTEKGTFWLTDDQFNEISVYLDQHPATYFTTIARLVSKKLSAEISADAVWSVSHHRKFIIPRLRPRPKGYKPAGGVRIASRSAKCERDFGK